MRKRRIGTPLAGLFLLLFLTAPRAQTRPPDIQHIERFRGSVRLAGKDVRVAIDTWLLPNATTIENLALPLHGNTVMELRGGSLFTTIAGQRLKRSAGDFWTVPSTSPVRLETEDDSAALQSTVVAE
jgi:hypothetical protein